VLGHASHWALRASVREDVAGVIDCSLEGSAGISHFLLWLVGCAIVVH